MLRCINQNDFGVGHSLNLDNRLVLDRRAVTGIQSDAVDFDLALGRNQIGVASRPQGPFGACPGGQYHDV